MAKSYDLYPAQSGVTTDYSISFDYLAASHVKATVDGTPVSFTFLSTFMVRMDVAPSGDLKIYRETPTDEIINEYTDGSVLIDDDLNRSFYQSLFISEEVGDAALQQKSDGKWDAVDQNIKNVADPTSPKDAVNKQTLDSLIGSNESNKQAAQAAATAAETAQVVAEGARDTALSAQVAAESARNVAQGYRDQSEANKDQTAADRVATGLDRQATAADVVSTNADAAQTAADKSATAADRIAAEAAATSAANNKTLTDADRVAADSARIDAENARNATQGYRDEADADRIAAEAAKTAAEQAAADAQNIANGSAYIQKVNNGTDFVDPAATLDHLVGNSENIELNRYGSGDRVGYLDFHAKNGSDYDFRIIRYAGENGGAEIAQLGTGNFYIGSNGDAPVILKQNGNNKFTLQSDDNIVASAPLLALRADFDAGLVGDSHASLLAVAKGATGETLLELWTDPAHSNRAWQLKHQLDGHMALWNYNSGWNKMAEFRDNGKLRLFGVAGAYGAESALQLIASSDPGISFENTVSGRKINLILYNGPTAELAVAGGYLGNTVYPLWHKGNLKVWSYTFSPVGGGYYALAHGMGIMPRMLQLKLVCTSAVHGFSVGQEHYIPVHWNSQDSNSKGVCAWQDSTNVYLRFGTDANWLPIVNTSGTFTDITATQLANNFDLVLETLAW